MNIDWSKAPEGATHKDLKYAPNGFWYKFDFKNDTAAYCLHGGSEWVPSGRASEYNDGSLDDMEVRPEDVAKSAADERLRQIRNASTAINLKIRAYNINLGCSVAIRATIEAMIDVGYRKFEIIEEDV